jgi:hypothetical protein
MPWQTATRKETAMTRRPAPRFRPQLEPLEDRLSPGTLLVQPPSFIDQNIGLAVPNNAKPGLKTAQAHTGGVITWFINPDVGL